MGIPADRLGFGLPKMNANPKSRNGLVCKKLGDEAMLYDPSNDNVHVLNITSLFIWELLDGRHTLKDIEAKMRENFSISSEISVLKDVSSALEDFRGKGLLE